MNEARHVDVPGRRLRGRSLHLHSLDGIETLKGGGVRNRNALPLGKPSAYPGMSHAT